MQVCLSRCLQSLQLLTCDLTHVYSCVKCIVSVPCRTKYKCAVSNMARKAKSETVQFHVKKFVVKNVFVSYSRRQNILFSHENFQQQIFPDLRYVLWHLYTGLSLWSEVWMCYTLATLMIISVTHIIAVKVFLSKINIRCETSKR